MRDSNNHSDQDFKDIGATSPPSGRSKLWCLLLLLPLIGLLYPPFYSHIHPMLGGVPFFIWYQFAWVFGGVATTLAVSRLVD